MEGRTYIAIDLKSFYASVECVERGLDPLRTCLVVADASRTEKTICLAVSPPLKSYGIPGRPRLFEVVQRVREVNESRRSRTPGHSFTGRSCDIREQMSCPQTEVSYIVAPPRMALYMEYSTRIYGIYLKYIAPEDIHVYSVDEVFMDVSQYLHTYRKTPEELASQMITDVYQATGITAAAGIGTNLYLCKVAMDIVAKHVKPDKNGVRIASLDEMSYRRMLWEHRPLTDFWRVGHGYARKLERNGLFTMGDIARCSIGKPGEYYNEELLYKLFGVNAELLIDHAWGWEPCTIADIKAYKPESSSIGAGQVLHCPYDYEKAMLVVKEMAEQLSLDLVEQGMVTDQVVLTVGFDRESLAAGHRYKGEVSVDRYGRAVPKHAHGTANLDRYSASTKAIVNAALEVYRRTVDPALLIRRLTICANHVLKEGEQTEPEYVQMDLFTDYRALQEEELARKKELEREKNMQKAVLDIKKRFGKNAVMKGMDLQEGATAISRNGQIGGHKA